ncbi:MAG: class I mannose-6-phosphate isomerase [Phycisphaerales bacterium]|nr:MAG: class I mannose-6-phosphate isomerase [Phycisphaerales bacterium]
MIPYPLKFRPIYKQRIWGGRKLEDFFGKDLPPGEKIGESWELADLPLDKSEVANGEFAGRNIRELIEEYPEQITGRPDFGPAFGLLIKFLDAEDILSVQVHPDEATCRRLGEGEPKTECWYIISAAPGAVIYKGLRQGVTREQFAAAVAEGAVAELLEKVPVAAGECHILPAGTAHSIGAGLLIAEIQTPSDTTYRVFDWNRVDSDGRARDLHIEQALESIHFDASRDALTVKTMGRLVDSEYFRVDKGHQAPNCEVLVSGGKMKTLVAITGGGTAFGTEGETVEFRAGETLLFPAAYEGVVRFAQDTQYLTITI